MRNIALAFALFGALVLAINATHKHYSKPHEPQCHRIDGNTSATCIHWLNRNGNEIRYNLLERTDGSCNYDGTDMPCNQAKAAYDAHMVGKKPCATPKWVADKLHEDVCKDDEQ